MDAALGLLHEFEEVDAVAIEFGNDDEDATLAIVQDQPRNSNDDRFRRAREKKKNELAFFRIQASGLERVLRVLKQQQRRQLSSTQPGVWELTALRQEQERREAELLNAQLRAMVYATVKRARQLKVLLAVPEALEPLVHHKRLHQHSVVSVAANGLELQSVILAVDLLEMQLDKMLGRIYDAPNVLKPRRDEEGCGLVVELMESSVLLHDVSTVSASAWQLLTLGGPQLDTKECQLSRIYTMELVSSGRCFLYQGTYFYRKRGHAGGRIVITWASSWTPISPSDPCDEGHESFRREGFVVVSPSSSDLAHSDVQVLHRVERDACEAQFCNKGAWGYATAKGAHDGVEQCVASEIKLLLQGVENQIVARGVENKCS